MNCGRCPKCVRTITTLKILDRLDRYETFPELRLRDQIKWLGRAKERVFTRENYELAKKRGKTGEALLLGLLSLSGELRGRNRRIIRDGKG